MRVLLVNDDGPPAPHSPHILGLYETLRRTHPTWDISVVLPSSQKSWGSMAFTLQPPCAVWYYYPQQGDHDGQHAREHAGAWSSVRRPVADNEVGEWMLVDGVSGCYGEEVSARGDGLARALTAMLASLLHPTLSAVTHDMYQHRAPHAARPSTPLILFVIGDAHRARL